MTLLRRFFLVALAVSACDASDPRFDLDGPSPLSPRPGPDPTLAPAPTPDWPAGPNLDVRPTSPSRVARHASTPLQQLYPYGSAALLTTGEVLFTGATSSARGELYDPNTGTSRTTGAMSAIRTLHTSTVLLDGRVLVAGGLVPTTIDGGVTQRATASAELYDPSTGAFTATGSMLRARESHTATLLRDGRVLIVTGYDNGNFANVELYDPTTGTFSAAAPLPQARYRHTATLLADGRVLVAGGWSATSFGVDNADVFDPSAGTAGSWSPVEPLIFGRVGHSATLLRDGRVLFAGGLSGDGRNRTELFDPTTQRFSPGPALIEARGNHSATLLPSGAVLLTGGSGVTANGVTPIHTSTELISFTGSTAGTVTAGLPLPGPRLGHAALMLPTGRLLLALGRRTFADGEANAVLFDTGTPTLTPTATPLNRRRGGTRTPLPNGEVLLVGGRDLLSPGFPALAATERFSAHHESFYASTPLLTGRLGHTATLLPSGEVLIAGGATPTIVELEPGVPTEFFDPVPSAELFLPHPPLSLTRVAAVRAAGSLISPRHGHRATLLPNGDVLLSGGQDRNGTITQLETFVAAELAFRPRPSMSIGSETHTATLLQDGRVLLVAEGSTALAELYDPSATPPTVTPTGAPAQTRIAGASATLLPDGRVLHAGGGGKTRAELYDPTTGLFTPTGPLNVGRNAHEAALLPSGRVLIVGGGAGAELYDPVTGTFSVIASAQTLAATTRLAGLPSGALLLTSEATGPARIFSEGLVPDRSSAPSLSRVEVDQGSFASGLALTLRGFDFDADFAQASRTSDASAHRPVVKFTRLDNGQVVLAKTIQSPGLASATATLTATLPAGLPSGPYRVSVIAGGRASPAQVFPSPLGASCTDDAECGAGTCVNAFCCADCNAFVDLRDGPYTQTFDTLASSGSTGSAMPSGWYFSEVGTAADTTYGVGTGTGTVGNTWSFGAANSTERALGGLQSASLNPTFGAAIRNGSTRTLSSVTLSYVGEQWRMGAMGREDRLDFQASLDATSLTTGTWIDLDLLDFIAPSTTGSTGARDGNLAENRRELSVSLPIPGGAAPGTVLWIRWTDFNPSGSDDGLAIDDLRLEPVFADPPPGPLTHLGFAARAATLPLIPGEVVGVDMTLTVDPASPEALREVLLSVRPVGALVQPIPGTLVLTVDGVSTPLTIEADEDRGEAGITADTRVGSLAIGSSATLSFDMRVLPGTDDILIFSGLGSWVGATQGTLGIKSGQLGGLSVAQCRDASHCVAGPACTIGGACQSGVCAPRTPRACDDGVVCTVDLCAHASDTCVSTPDHARCDDDELCTSELCDATSGCQYTQLTGSCDDGDGCTTNDQCSGGECAGSARSCDDGNACTIDSCSAGQCTHTPLACGVGQVCQAGVCAPTRCTSCDETTSCGAQSACVESATGPRCLVACEDDEDCGDGEICELASDDVARCFDLEGECRAPDPEPVEEVEPGPEEVEPGPEEVEPQPETAEPAPDTTDGPDTDVTEIADASDVTSGDTSPEPVPRSKDEGCGASAPVSTPIGLFFALLLLAVWRAGLIGRHRHS